MVDRIEGDSNLSPAQKKALYREMTEDMDKFIQIYTQLDSLSQKHEIKKDMKDCLSEMNKLAISLHKPKLEDRNKELEADLNSLGTDDASIDKLQADLDKN